MAMDPEKMEELGCEVMLIENNATAC